MAALPAAAAAEPRWGGGRGPGPAALCSSHLALHGLWLRAACLSAEAACGRASAARGAAAAAEGGRGAGAEAEAPAALHAAFSRAEVRQWEPARFRALGKLQDAVRNKGQVHRMLDVVEGRSVAVKKMPNDWACSGQEDFLAQHPSEMEHPWQDVGCTAFLNRVGYPYACRLLGVYRDAAHTYVVSELASEGDLFSWCADPAFPAPGLGREAHVAPVARCVFDAVLRLHEMSIVHNDISLENILLAGAAAGGGPEVRVIDFGMAATGRRIRRRVRGKAAYQAPETHTEEEYDGFLADAFAVGVALYAALVKDYPWLSTREGQCKCFEYVCKHGFRAYLRKRKLPGGGSSVAQHLSEPSVQLLEGLLALDPTERLTLGESAWPGRRSVWDEPWLLA